MAAVTMARLVKINALFTSQRGNRSRDDTRQSTQYCCNAGPGEHSSGTTFATQRDDTKNTAATPAIQPGSPPTIVHTAIRIQCLSSFTP